jgi:hypothetical protein
MGEILAKSNGEGRMFFSEEKNQKTFASAWVHRYGTWPGKGAGSFFGGGQAVKLVAMPIPLMPDE